MSTEIVRLYLSGPMSGLPDSNYPAFCDMADKLRGAGYLVINPAENQPPPCGTWAGYLKIGLAQLMWCDGVALLDGWQCSKGAKLEAAVATILDIPTESASVWLSRMGVPDPALPAHLSGLAVAAMRIA